MNLKDIISVSGESGLFRFLAQGRNAIIVEHLDTNKRQTVSASAKVSSLEEIAVFTDAEELKLSIVFDRMWDKADGNPVPDPKSSTNSLTAYFAEIVPEYDRARVYASDIKKIISWYGILHKLNLLVKEEEVGDGKSEVSDHNEPATGIKAAATRKSTAVTPTKLTAAKKGTGSQAKKRITPVQRKQS